MVAKCLQYYLYYTIQHLLGEIHSVSKMAKEFYSIIKSEKSVTNFLFSKIKFKLLNKILLPSCWLSECHKINVVLYMLCCNISSTVKILLSFIIDKDKIKFKIEILKKNKIKFSYIHSHIYYLLLILLWPIINASYILNL